MPSLGPLTPTPAYARSARNGGLQGIFLVPRRARAENAGGGSCGNGGCGCSCYVPESNDRSIRHCVIPMSHRVARNECPACGAALWAPDNAWGEKQCPRCFAELWFVPFSGGRFFFVRRQGESLAEFLCTLVAPAMERTPAELEQVIRKSDSLELVELVMEIEEAMESRFGRVG
jgi:hypothetical protein